MKVSRLRQFLKQAATEPTSAQPSPSTQSTEPRCMIVIIDHHAAHVFQDLGGSRPQEEVSIKPYDPHHFHHHLVHRKEAHYRGERVPEETSFYAEVVDLLVPAQEIVLIGHGTGTSSAVDVLMAYLKKHRSDVAKRVIATETADLSALTLPEAEAIARRHMTAAAAK